MSRELPETVGYSRLAITVNAAIALAVTAGTIYLASRLSAWHEGIFRVGPVPDGSLRGVGADWVIGNTIPALDFAIALIHAIDVLMGLFILIMVFIHWGAFRRLAARMQQPDEVRAEGAVTDGGRSDTTGDIGGDDG